ncbi:MAG: HEAT repeat domain-containing protein [Cyanobacteria bacterium P01_D01_bin.56]
MIWRSTLVLFTSLAALAVSVESLRAGAESSPSLLAQSSVVDPNSAVDTGQAVPNFSGTAPNSPLESAISEEQVEEIKALQQELKKRGYYNGPIDGIYGPGTEAAIIALRGQEQRNSTSALLTPESAPPADTSLEQPEQALTETTETFPQSGESPDSPEANEAAIGDDVSPDTGVDSTEPTASETENTTGTPPPAGRPGSMLWAGLALIAALGSFGIGFVLVNRANANDGEAESPWGAFPPEIPQTPQTEIPRLNQTASSDVASLNGYGAAATHTHLNGVVIDSPAAQPQTNVSITPTANAMPNIANHTAQLAKVDIIDELVSNLQVPDPAKRKKAIWELGQRGNSSAVQPLVSGMVDADSKEKSLILAALSEIGIRSLKPMSRALAIALQDENPDVRKNAIRDLTRVYDLVTQISQMLGHATEDEDPEVRRTAEWALGQLSRIREAPKLKSSTNHNSLEASHSSTELLPEDMENLKN